MIDLNWISKYVLIVGLTNSKISWSKNPIDPEEYKIIGKPHFFNTKINSFCNVYRNTNIHAICTPIFHVLIILTPIIFSFFDNF